MKIRVVETSVTFANNLFISQQELERHQNSALWRKLEKTHRAANAFSRQRVVIGGGVACNRTLAEAMRTRFARDGVTVFTPTPRLATDNAAMIARAGFFRFEQGERAGG